MCLRFGSDPRAAFLGRPPEPERTGMSTDSAAAPAAQDSRLPADIVLAANRIGPYVRETPLQYSRYFSETCGARVWFKLENFQVTGSFKIRGACNKLLTTDRAELARGCVAASSGNHGAAVAHATQELGIDCVVFVPEKSSSAKVDAIRRAGAEVRFHGTDGLDTEQFARGYADEQGMVYVSPYNDRSVVAGQGSCGVEIGRQLADIDAVFVAVGGGGLIGGVGTLLKTTKPGIEIVACQPAASAVMTESVRAGRLIDMESDETLSDGTAGGIEADAITFDICRRVVDRYVVVDEERIAAAMRAYIDAEHQLLEGAAGVAVAALLDAGDRYAGQNVVVVVCGGNISRETLKAVL